MSKIVKLIYLTLISIIMVGCSNDSRLKTFYKEVVLSDKTIEYNSESTNYVLAFTDKTQIYTTFGVYTAYNIGDTICLTKTDHTFDFYWDICDCDNLNKLI